MTSECTLTVNVDEYGPTCEYILEEYGLTIAQFYEWNPSVGPDCGGMWLGEIMKPALCMVQSKEKR